MTGGELNAVEVQKPSVNISFEPSILSTGLDYLDSEIGGLRCGRTYLFKGSHELVEHLVYQAMAMNTTETNRPALFVGCRNSFNPYRIARICRSEGLDERRVLESILLSRPFTAYQLNTLLEENLYDVMRKNPVLVIFSYPLSLFDTEDVEEGDARIILKKFQRDLRKRSGPDFPLIITEAPQKRHGLDGLQSAAESVFSFRQGRNKTLRFTTEKDPLRPKGFIDFTLQRTIQDVLDKYIDGRN